MPLTRRAMLVSSLMIAGCDGSGADPEPLPEVDAGPGSPVGPDTLEPVIGSIRLLERVTSGRDGSVVTVSTGNSVLAATEFPSMAPRVFGGYQRETERIGSCRLLEHQPGFCDPACDGFCVEPGECLPFLDALSAGPISVGGTKQPVSMSFQAPYGYLRLDQIPNQFDMWDAGDAITARADGDVFEGFELTATGVDRFPLGVLGESVELFDDVDLELTWESAENTDTRVRLTLMSPNRGHGTPVAAIIECDEPERGHLTVPRQLIARLPPDTGGYCAGYDCPPSSLVRYTRATSETDGGTIELVVGTIADFRTPHNPDQAER